MSGGPTAGRLAASLSLAFVAAGHAATFPSDSRVEFQTSGCQRPATVGDWYTSSASSSSARYGDFFLEVTETMAPATVEILDAESTDGPGSICDEVDGAACDGAASGTSDPARFELRSGDGTVLLQGTTVPSGTAHDSTVTFSGLGVGLYRIRSYTGSDEIAWASCGTNPVADNNDDNSFKIRINDNASIDGLLGFLQTSYQQETGGPVNYQCTSSPAPRSRTRRWRRATSTSTAAPAAPSTTARPMPAAPRWQAPSLAMVSGTTAAR